MMLMKLPGPNQQKAGVRNFRRGPELGRAGGPTTLGNSLTCGQEATKINLKSFLSIPPILYKYQHHTDIREAGYSKYQR